MRATADYRVSCETTLADFLAGQSGLPKARLKDCMSKGGVWVQRAGGKVLRNRKAKTGLHAGDRVFLYYDESILGIKPFMPRLLADHVDYSVWDKPAGLLAQGTQFGDHCSLLRLAQLYFSPVRDAFLIHRLDREASGLMVIAHSKGAAAALSRIFQSRLVRKQYVITVLGGWQKAQGCICLPLDGKEAVTEYQLLGQSSLCSSPPEGNGTGITISRLLITLQTGRLHQIRRHFAMQGFPVMGDPKYGVGNQNETGLALRAVRLAFECPLSGQHRDFRVEEA
ncbi:MAG: RluA family pseudouridine synthase [Desulfobulbaceae bacterium]|nr:RluA family pseudouridine synthase [Desulfobulbaceae bacterium]